MDLASLLANFGVQNGIGNLKLDARGTCRLSFDNRWFVDLQLCDESPVSSSFLLRCAVGNSGNLSAEALRRLLAANFFAIGPHDAVVALDARHQEVVLIRRHESGSMNHTKFLSALTEFVNQATYWGELLHSGNIENSDKQSEDSDTLSQQHGFLRA